METTDNYNPATGKTEGRERLTKQQLSLYRPGTWTDIQAYFMQLFEARPEMDQLQLIEDELINDMAMTFKKKHDAEAIGDLLKNGFASENGLYTFKRKDFFPDEKVMVRRAAVEEAVKSGKSVKTGSPEVEGAER